MYTVIKAYCVDQALQVASIPKLASGGENCTRIEVTFDVQWTGYGKVAVLYRTESQVFHVVMVDDACIIPRELMAEPGVLYFGILGTSGAVTRTSEVVALAVEQGAITGLSPLSPLPDVYKQVLSAYGELGAALTVERARIDNLVAGGTAEGTEVADIRVGANGAKYPTAGAAVRSQVDSLLIGKNRVTSSNVTPGKYVIYTTGEVGAHSNYSFVSVPVRSGDRYYISDTDNTHIAFFNGEPSVDNYLTGYNKAQYVTVPEGAVLMTVSVKTANVAALEVYTRLTGGAIFDGEITAEKLSSGLRAVLKKTVVVGAGEEYTSILRALKENPGAVRVLVKSGTYDLVSEYADYYGADYFDKYKGYAGTGDAFDAGLFLSDGCELIGAGEVALVFDYQGDNTAVKNYFSPLNTSQNNVVGGLNFTIRDGSCRYIIHDDFATAAGTNVFRNCTFNGSSSLTTSMGCGMGTANTYVIENCYFFGNGGLDIAYHNNAEAGVNALSIRNCYCTGAIRGAHYGTSTQKSKMLVSGCRASKIYLAHGDEVNYPNQNLELVAWNNELTE